MGNQKKQKKAALGFSVISLSLIDRNSFNPRKVFNEEALEELALSIKGKGVIQPIVVRPVGNRYEIVCGERRFRASLIAGMENIPACIKELSDDEAEEYAITENLQRKEVSPLEEAEAFSKLVSGGKYDINSLVIKFGKSEAFIRGRLKLVNLIMEFRNMLEKDAINIGVAGVLACYPNDLQNKIYIEHFDENCLGWQSWINYKASRVQYAIEDTYSTKLEKYAFDKEECKNCPYNNATFSLFVEGVGTCAKRECLTEKNAMYIYQQVIDMQNANPGFGICKHPCLSTNANVIEKLQENGYEVQTIYATNDYEEPELPSRDEYENEDDFNDAMNEYEEEKQEYENAIEDRNALVAAGDIKPYIQVGMNEVKIVYAEAPKSEEEEINTEWVLIMKRQVCLSGWYDAFGELYMSCIAGNARKQSNGQFFTPAHICDLMAELCGSQDNSVELCGDPACGSGRNLLAWHVKHLSSYLCAEDIDRTCCLMTVCNFLIHGCVGEVIWHDSLNPDTYYDGWKVNERLAITGLPAIRRIAKEESVVWQTWQNQRDDAKGHVITPIKKINIRKKREEAKRMQLDLFD